MTAQLEKRGKQILPVGWAAVSRWRLRRRAVEGTAGRLSLSLWYRLSFCFRFFFFFFLLTGGYTNLTAGFKV
jgi:hypothetical protein